MKLLRVLFFFILIISIIYIGLLVKLKFKIENQEKILIEPKTIQSKRSGLLFKSINTNNWQKSSLFNNTKNEFRDNFRGKSYCDNEWEVLDDKFYFKKSAAFLFIDVKHTFIYFVARYPFSQKFNLKLMVYKKNGIENLTEINLKNVLSYKYTIYDNYGPYGLYALKAFYDVNELKSYGNINELTIKAFPFLTERKITSNSIILKIKNFRGIDGLKKEAMICQKIAYFNGNSYKDLEWWFTLNKKIGFDKIVLYNNSIANEKNFNDLFYKYKDFVEIRQMQCFPDVINNTNSYVRNIKDLTFGKIYVKGSRRVQNFYSVLVYNECFLENIDKYKYISNIDSDELIIPRLEDNFFPLKKNLRLIDEEKNRKFTIKSQCQKPILNTNPLVDYRKNLNTVVNLRDTTTIYFKNAHYLKRRVIMQIFKQFIEFYREFNFNIDKYSIYIKNLNITFTISNKEEHDYSRYLHDIYKKYLIPLYEKMESIGIPESFNRFFFIANKNSASIMGKNIFSSKTALHLSAHGHFGRSFHINYDYGHLSHFRDKIFFRNQIIPISDLYFDLNYLNCYFLKIYENYNGID